MRPLGNPALPNLAQTELFLIRQRTSRSERVRKELPHLGVPSPTTLTWFNEQLDRALFLFHHCIQRIEFIHVHPIVRLHLFPLEYFAG